MSPGKKPGSKLSLSRDPVEKPPGLPVFRLEQVAGDGLQGLRLDCGPVEKTAGPALGGEGAPKIVLPGFVDRVVLAWAVLHREADRDGLLVAGVRYLGGMRLPGFGTKLCPEDVLHGGQREHVPVRGCVDEIGCLDEHVAPSLEPPDLHTGDAVSMRPRGERAVRVQHEQPPAQLMG